MFSTDYLFSVFLFILCVVTDTQSALNEKLNYNNKSDEVTAKFGKLLASLANLNEKRNNALKQFHELDTYNIASGVLRDTHDQNKTLVVILTSNDYDLEDTGGLLNNIYNNGPNKVPRETAALYLFKARNHNSRDRENIYNKLRNRVTKGMKGDTLEESDDSDSDANELTNKNIIKEQAPINETTPPAGDGKEMNDGNTMNELSDDTKLGPVETLRIWKSYNKKAIKRCKKACKAAYKSTCKDYKCSKSMKKAFKKSCKRECKDVFD